MLTIYGPLYIVGAANKCWKCGSDNEVVTVACMAVEVEANAAIEHAEPGELFLLNYIRELPADLIQFVTGLAPNYRKLYSRTADEEYLANVCECGANFGDWYLFNEPDGPWFPNDDSEVETTRVVPVPLAEPLPVDCEFTACRVNIAASPKPFVCAGVRS